MNDVFTMFSRRLEKKSEGNIRSAFLMSSRDLHNYAKAAQILSVFATYRHKQLLSFYF